jgi:hypothetical protein
MPGSGITIANQFATQSGNVPASQLDTNFNQLASGANALSTYANYFVDSGAVNAMAITILPPLSVSYTAGLTLEVLVANTNTGAVTLNVNGLGPINVVNPSGGAPLTAGQIVAGQIAPLQFDGTNFQYQGPQAVTAPSGAANLVYATPNGSSGGATLRALVSADIPGGTVLSSAGTFTGTMTGLTAVSGLVNFNITGNICSLYTTVGLFGTSTSNSLSMTGLPANVRPLNQQICICWVIDNSISEVLALAGISAGGSVVNFNRGVVTGTAVLLNSGTSFTGGPGTKGISAGWMITYPLL